jgi:hypothetical protein
MVYIDQLPWHELSRSPEMALQCEDDFLRSTENYILQLLYRWKHFPCDMVVENRIDIPKAIRGFDYGMHIVEETRETDTENDIRSHKYSDQAGTPEQLAALKADVIEADAALDKKHLEIATEIFGGIIPVRLCGVQIHSGVWDRIAQMRSVTKVLDDIIDRPEFIVDVVKKFVELTNSDIDQCEKLGLLDEKLQYVHCTGAYTNDLPKKASPDAPALAGNVWSFGMAQLFTTVSPAMHEEFEIDLVKPLYERFGLMYYGCCEPLERKIGIIRKIKNVRKISVSPWAKIDECADNIGSDYVLSLKSHPAYIAVGFDEASVRKQIETALAATKRSGGALEIILKDVSTVENDLARVDRWNKIAMSYAEG